MLRQTWMSASFCLACAIASCRGVSHREMLETKLRQQEDQLAEFSSRLDQTQSELLATQRAADALRKQLADRGQAVLAAEQSAVLHRAAEIRVQSWLSGGVDRDGVPGDEGLSVLVLPVDATGDTLKLPGALDIELLDLSQPTGEQSIAHRQFPPDRVETLWHRGFLGTGYLIELTWDRIPAHPDLTLNVKLTAPDGRLFHTTHSVKVQPPEPDSTAGRAGQSVHRPASFDSITAMPNPGAKPRLDKGPVGQAPAEERPVLDTSDRFTEETIPRLR